jgi:signal-transduction protein with cAMP-binding, CBS, and nucleotidyltransferase domain
MLEMTRSRMRHLPVVDHGELCGVVSIGDVVKNRLDETGREVTLLRDAYLGRG